MSDEPRYHKPGVEYLYRCTGETTGERHPYSVFGWDDKLAMDQRIADDWARCDCGSPYKRSYTTFQFAKPMPPHYNLAAGKYVESERQLTEHYHRLSEETSERLNLPHDFQPVSQSEKSALNITPEGLSATVQRRDELKMPVAEKVRKLAKEDG